MTAAELERRARVRATVEYLRACQAARAAGCRVSFVTDPGWLVNQAVNRRAGWLEEPGARGSSQAIAGRLPRKCRADWQRHLRLIAGEVNTPRLVVRPARLGEHRWLVDRLPGRFELEGPS